MNPLFRFQPIVAGWLEDW
uniref:Uncharacterized protein n=1 Tax=Anguilla anguilla TaxID=7936 RepID=A0A0E9UU60_ANGAN